MGLPPRELIFRTAELMASAWSREDIRRAVARGELVRLRRGWFCHSSVWGGLDERERHVLRGCAVAGDVADPVLAGRSAAAVWGIPVLGQWPHEVTLLTTFRGGGKSEPGVRRTSIGAIGAEAIRYRGLTVTTIARTVVDLAASEGFVAGVMAADWALAHGLTRSDLEAARIRRSSRRGSAIAAAAISFADAAAESPGESAARAAIFQLGFETPELQVALRDRVGEMRVDFFWRAAGKVGEFDGKVKYLRHEYTGGDPGEVVWQEKRREDRLRAITNGVVRILWAQVMNPPELAAVLTAAGIPRLRNT